MKKIFFNNQARAQIKAGIDKCVDVVKVSLGGNGKNVLIYNGSNSEVINDGVSIAKQIEVKNETEQAGIMLARQCADQTNIDAGDGTTTTLVLLQSILNEIIQDIQTENPRELREKLFNDAKNVLDNISVSEIKTKEDIYNLALTSSLDEGVATIISDIYDKLGKDAKVSVEEMSRDVLETEIINGIQFESKPGEKQLLSAYEKTIVEDVDVLVTEKVMTTDDIQKGVEKAIKRGKASLVVIANSFDRNVLISIMKLAEFKIIPIEYNNLRTLDDIKEYVGKEPVKKVIIDDSETIIIGGKGDVKKRVKFLKNKKKEEQSEYEKEQLDIRIGNLTSGIATIKVGKNTDVERNELVLKIEDALGSVRGAYELGFVQGGGTTLSKASKVCPDTYSGKVIKKACESVFKQICDNAGEDVEVSEKVIDSFKTVKHSLLNALSTATSVLTVEACLIEENED